MMSGTRTSRIIFASAAALVAVGALAFFRLIPHAVDRKANALGGGVIREPAPTIPALHSSLRIVDLHADTLLWDRDLLERGDRGHVDVPRLQEGNVALQVFSVVTKSPRRINYAANDGDSDNITLLAVAQRWPPGTWSSLSERALHQARRLHEAVAGSGGQLRLVRDRADLTKLLEDRQTNRELVGAVLAIEGGHALEGDLAKMEALGEQGFRMIGPAHLFDSELSGSQQGRTKSGLSELGRAWVAEMDRREWIIDLAHVSSAAIDEILTLSSRAPVVSHTGFKAVCDNNRNLSDEQVRRIVAKGGLIGVGFWDEVTCAPTLDSVVRSLRHAVTVAGIDHVALGSDWDGFVRTPIDAARTGWLTAKLVEAGFSEDEIRKIMGENALTFFAKWLPSTP